MYECINFALFVHKKVLCEDHVFEEGCVAPLPHIFPVTRFSVRTMSSKGAV